jgi:hypothetical protein
LSPSGGTLATASVLMQIRWMKHTSDQVILSDHTYETS